MHDDSWTIELTEGRILVVDDEGANLRLLERLLQKHGYQHIVCEQDPNQVVLHMQTFQPDLILLDMNMPGISGQDLLGRLHPWVQGSIPVPVLVLTGLDNLERRRAALQAGARDFVAKPFDPAEVLVRIRNLMESRLLMSTLNRHRATLEEEVRARTAELRESELELAQRLGVAAEFRDDDTGLHTNRVSRLAASLARALGWSEARCALLEKAAPLHDIGKIGIPDAILLKPGKLDPGEWAVMKTHVEIGAKILEGSRSELLRLAQEVILGHHERWDGSGYPRGQAGPDIPAAARIVSICDVFDALTSERPYKRAWSAAEAVAEIQRCAGTQFDPELVSIFLSLQVLEARP